MIDFEVTEDIQQKFKSINERLKELKFFPLKRKQHEQLIEVCKTYSLEQIISALEQTAARCIYAWKYAYKVLLTSVTSQKRPAFRKRIIHKERVPDWFHNINNETVQPPESKEDPLAKLQRMRAIQMKYKKKSEPVSLASLQLL